uniref:Uncharacterized protein n=1 Tax=Anguilla anguilla TaxID=7936 RepID=A0A0E9RNX8_ANGAN
MRDARGSGMPSNPRPYRLRFVLFCFRVFGIERTIRPWCLQQRRIV